MNNTSLFFIQKKVEFCCEKIGLGFISLTYDERGALSTAPLPFFPPIFVLLSLDP